MTFLQRKFLVSILRYTSLVSMVAMLSTAPAKCSDDTSKGTSAQSSDSEWLHGSVDKGQPMTFQPIPGSNSTDGSLRINRKTVNVNGASWPASAPAANFNGAQWPLSAPAANFNGAQWPLSAPAANLTGAQWPSSAPAANVNGTQWPKLGVSTDASSIPKLNVKSPDRANVPVISVQDATQNGGGGLGLLGMYALCPDDTSPCYITNVFPSSELNQFGIESGDLLTKINGVSPFDYMHSIHPIKPGAYVSLTVTKNGMPKMCTVKLLDIRMFTPFFASYGQWATSHIAFMKEHHAQYHSCGLF